MTTVGDGRARMLCDLTQRPSLLQRLMDQLGSCVNTACGFSLLSTLCSHAAQGQGPPVVSTPLT